MSKEQIAKIRALRSLDPGKVESFDRIALCDSHEALRAEVARLTAERDAVARQCRALVGRIHAASEGLPQLMEWAARDTARAEGGEQ